MGQEMRENHHSSNNFFIFHDSCSTFPTQLSTRFKYKTSSAKSHKNTRRICYKSRMSTPSATHFVFFVLSLYTLLWTNNVLCIKRVTANSDTVSTAFDATTPGAKTKVPNPTKSSPLVSKYQVADNIELQIYKRVKRNTSSSPRFTHLFQETILDPGSKFSIKCEAVGSPLPQITWTLDGLPIIESHSRIRIGDYVTNQGVVNSFINLTSVRIEDGGLYSCSASNGPEVITHSARINVKGNPHVKPIRNLTVISGERVYVDCPYSGHPIGSITWERRSSPSMSSDHHRTTTMNDHPTSWIKLPQNHRQVVYPNGTLIIRKVDRSNDEDYYRCLVTAGGGESSSSFASSSFHIKVVIAPIISPFSSPPNLWEGMRSLLTCSVLEGDPPFEFKWFKNDRLIYDSASSSRSGDDDDGNPMMVTESSIIDVDDSKKVGLKTFNNGDGSQPAMLSNMKITTQNEYSSTLFISKVTHHDSANFTCIVSNPAASTNYTISHLVKVPPKWLVAPMDTKVIQGRDVTINCQATGYPHPRIWWERASDATTTNPSGGSTIASIPSHYVPVISNSHIHALENGSLIIKDASKSDEGSYLCQATNGVSTGISKVVKISVRAPPSFRSAFNAVTVRKGEPVLLNCEASGERPISMSWTKDRMAFDPSSDPSRYDLSSTSLPIKTGTGMDQVVQLLVDPSTPAVIPADTSSNKLHTVSSSSTAVTPPSSATFFGLIPKNEEETSGHTEPGTSTAGTDSIGRMQQLLTRSQLKIKSSDRKDSALYTCIAVNNFGRAEYNLQLMVQEPPDKPENVVATSIYSRSAIITWTMSYTGNSAITSFQIESKSFIHSSLSSSASSGTSHSSPLFPSSIDTISSSSSSWSDGSLTSDSFLSSSSTWVVQTVTGNSNSITLRKLKPLTRIQVRIRAENMFGWSEYSDILNFVTEEEAPGGPPLQIKAIALSSRSVKVTWKPPRQDLQYGSIKGYYVGYRIFDIEGDSFIYKTLEGKQQSNHGHSSMSTYNHESTFPADECHLTGLKRFTKYAIIVQAFNSKGTGPSSEIIEVQTLQNDPPSAPILKVSSVTTSTIHLTWSVPGSTSSSDTIPSDQITVSSSDPILGFILHQKKHHPSSDTGSTSGHVLTLATMSTDWEEIRLSSDRTSHTFERLACGSKYQYFITAFNSVGKSDPSEILTAKTEGNIPVAPDKNSLLSVNTTAAYIYLDSWIDGACPISSFEIQHKARKSNRSKWDSNLVFPASLITKEMSDSELVNNQNQLNSGEKLIYGQKFVIISDLLPSTIYDLKIIANNEAGSTEVLYTFTTASRTSGGAILGGNESVRHGNNLVNFDLTLLLPTTISLVIVIIVIFSARICLMKKRQLDPNTLYNGSCSVYEPSSKSGAESVCLTGLGPHRTPKNKNGIPNSRAHIIGSDTGSNFPNPYDLTKLNGGDTNGPCHSFDTTRSRTKPLNPTIMTDENEPMCATIKRTARNPRTGGADCHLYQYPCTFNGTTGLVTITADSCCGETDSGHSLNSPANGNNGPTAAFLRFHESSDHLLPVHSYSTGDHMMRCIND